MKGIENKNDGKKSLHGIRRNRIRRNGIRWNGIRRNGIRRNGIRRNGNTPLDLGNRMLWAHGFGILCTISHWALVLHDGNWWVISNGWLSVGQWVSKTFSDSHIASSDVWHYQRRDSVPRNWGPRNLPVPRTKNHAQHISHYHLANSHLTLYPYPD